MCKSAFSIYLLHIPVMYRLLWHCYISRYQKIHQIDTVTKNCFYIGPVVTSCSVSTDSSLTATPSDW